MKRRLAKVGSARAARRRVRRRPVVIIFAGLLVAAGLVLYGPWTAAFLARQAAAARLRTCAIGAAQRWLARSAWLAPDDWSTDLLKATAHRYASQGEAWSKALEDARRKGAPDGRLRLERRLGEIQWGALRRGAEAEIHDLADAGASEQDVFTSYLRGYLAVGDVGMAGRLLEQSLKHYGDRAHGDYLWGVYWRFRENHAEAESRLRQALDLQPGHELARAELAELYEQKGQLGAAQAEYAELLGRSGGSEGSLLGLARVSRKLVRLEAARLLVEPLVSRPEPARAALVEMGRIEAEAGRYEEAEGWFGRVPLDGTSDTGTLSAAAVVFVLRGKTAEAERLFAMVDDVGSRAAWIPDLRARLATNPDDVAAAEELQRLARSPSERLRQTGALPAQGAGASTADQATAPRALYAQHCSACHGETGDGLGRAGRHLFPPPRDFGSPSVRLVSTRNGVPALEDVVAVLRDGIPGTSMPPLEQVSEADRRRLAEEVLRMRRARIRERLTWVLRAEDEPADAEEIDLAIERATVAGEPIPVPAIGAPDAEALRRGRDVYRSLGCGHCHGDDGSGAADQSLFDDQGYPNRARDLVREPFKGGRQPRSVYLRVLAGMPGTAHPATPNLSDRQSIELVHYVLSLGRAPQRVLTNHQRRDLATAPAYLATIGELAQPLP